MKSSLNKFVKGEKINTLKISESNRKKIAEFIKSYISHLDEARINKYRYSLMRFASLIEKDFDKLTEDDVQRINAVIGKSNLSEKTLQDFVSEVKNFYKRVFGKGKYTPENVAGLTAPRQKGKLHLPEEMLSEEDIYKMIKACNNSRDRFFIALMGLDGALRPVECRRMLWEDIKKDRYGHFIIVKTAKKSGDKDTRAVRIIKSEPYFIKWNQEYPSEKKDSSFVFVNYSDLKPMNEGTIAALFRRLHKKLGFKQRLYPYLLRHSLITKMSKDPTIPVAILKKFVGHSLKSNTISEYQHIGDEDIKDMQLQINGIVKIEEEKKIEKKPIKCPKCSKSNEYDAEFCSFCNMALSQKRMVESVEKLKEFENKLKKTDSQRDALNKMMYMLARKELARMKGKPKEEMEETLDIISEGLKNKD